MQSLFKLAFALMFLGLFFFDPGTADAQSYLDLRKNPGTMNRDSGDNDDDGIKIPPRVAPNDNNDDTRLSGTDLHQQNQNQDQEKKTRTTPTRTTPLFDVMQMEFTLPNQHESVRTYTVRK